MEQGQKGRIQVTEDLQDSIRLGGFLKFSLNDFPGKLAAVIFTQGCNYRCYYCHNPGLVYRELFEKPFPPGPVLDFLAMRRGKLEGVVVTGGEPLLHPGLDKLLKQIKDLGYLIKLDTNGSHPARLKTIMRKGLADYVAMDLKAPPDNYKDLIKTEADPKKLKQSIALLTADPLPHEFRITLAKPVCREDSLHQMACALRGCQKVILQKCIEKDGAVLNPATLDRYKAIFAAENIACRIRD